MFIYMSKKIAIPKHAGISCLSWNQQAGYIALGGDDGMLKVLKLESGGGGNLSMNLSLEGHTGQLQVATWNEIHQKLTTSDEHGVIIVWMLYKGSWYEEMINNRNKSTVSGMAWSSDGQKICIAYEDGAVIVGSVDGSRVWGKDIKGSGLSGVQWSPDNSLLLFALSSGELHLYDNQGNFAMALPVQCTDIPAKVVGMHWYANQSSPETPALAVCYQSGHIQLMKGHNDDGAVLIDSGLQAVSCHWNHNGTVIAVAGTGIDDTNAVQFFTPFGEHLRTLRVPAGGMKACVWEGRSLRVAIAVDSFIYFANVKPDYKKAYYGNTLAFASSQHTVTFWDTSTNQSWLNHIPNVVDMCGIDDFCVVATSHSLFVCNQQGVQCDAKVTPMEIMYACMNSDGFVIAASKDCFMLWRFCTASNESSKEQIFYSDGTPCLGEFQTSQDSISCIACSDSILLIGRESGDILTYSMPDLSSKSTYKVPNKPHKLAINSNSSKFSVIDTAGGLFLIDISEDAPPPRIALRKDVWGALWATDNPQLIAVMEKARLYILKGTEPEEPLTAEGYLCQFQELEIICAKLSELGERGEAEHLIRMEVKSLRDTRQLLDKVGLKEAEAFINDNPHPKLWRLLAEEALKKLDLQAAETAYVRCQDYSGIQLVKRLSALRGTALRSAEVLACFKQFDEAEKIYLKEDRRDLAILLRQRLGHWFRVVELLKMSTNTTEAQLKEAYNNIGHYYHDRQNWTNAREYYTLSNNQDGLIKCHIALEDTEALAKLSISSPRRQHLIQRETRQVVLNNSDTVISQKPTLVGALQLKDAGQFPQSAGVIIKLAESENTLSRCSPVKMKKLYVLAGMLYQNAGDTSSAALCWKKAGSWHWLAMAQRLGSGSGEGNNASGNVGVGVSGGLRAASRLRERCPSPPPGPAAAAALALAAANARAFATCSQAFVQLEALPDGELYADLAVEIFSKHPPKDPQVNRAECASCNTMVSDWATSCTGCDTKFAGCAVSGSSIHDSHSVWTCQQCQHTVAQPEIVLRQTCPVCHAQVLLNS